MHKHFSVELSMSHVCETCGKSNVVALAKLTTNPTCEHCGKPLKISEGEKVTAKAMRDYANSAGEVIDEN